MYVLYTNVVCIPCMYLSACICRSHSTSMALCSQECKLPPLGITLGASVSRSSQGLPCNQWSTQIASGGFNQYCLRENINELLTSMGGRPVQCLRALGGQSTQCFSAGGVSPYSAYMCAGVSPHSAYMHGGSAHTVLYMHGRSAHTYAHTTP